MSLDVLAGIVRAVVPAIATWLIVKYGLPEGVANQLAGYAGDAIIAVICLIFAIWAAKRNRQATQIKKVAGMDGVKEVVVDPKVSVPTTPGIIEKIKITSR